MGFGGKTECFHSTMSKCCLRGVALLLPHDAIAETAAQVFKSISSTHITGICSYLLMVLVLLPSSSSA